MSFIPFQLPFVSKYCFTVFFCYDVKNNILGESGDIMSRFSINHSEVKNIGNAISTYSGTLHQCGSQISDVKDSLDGSLDIVRPALETVIVNTYDSSTRLDALGQGLVQIAAAYALAESNILAGQKGPQSINDTPGDSRDGNSEVFDSTGLYGGNQSNLGTVDDDFCDWVRTHPGYEGLTNDEIRALLAKLGTVGCNWTAAANMIFAEFDGKEDEFKAKFGFDMKDANGELNFNKLIADIFLNTQGEFYVGKNDIYGKKAVLDSLTNYYRHNPSEFESKYGYNPLDSNGKLTSKAMKAITSERDQMVRDATDGVVKFENDEFGLGTDEFPNRLNHYLRDKGITNFKYDSQTTYSNRSITKALNKGKDVIICAKDFSLYDPSTGAEVRSNVGAHAMVVTGITPDGNYIVSSWGQQFIYKPGNGTTYHTAIMDINKG